jgi:dynein light intermediate chain
MAAPAKDSLVKYDVPVMVMGNKRRGKAAVPKLDKKTQLPSTEEVLNAILPPREWSHDGQLWAQYVASTPATRIDVVNLQEALDLKLQQRQARETGICPVREELYAQCFGTLRAGLWRSAAPAPGPDVAPPSSPAAVRNMAPQMAC